MRRWALYAAVTFCVAGCTRLNGAFVEERADTDGPTQGSDASTTTRGVTGDPTLSPTQSSDATTDTTSTTNPPLTMEGPAGSETHSESTTADEGCISVSEQDPGCDLFSPDSCRDGECRPYGSDEEFEGIGCVEQLSAVPQVGLGEGCTQECGGLLGTNGCPSGSTCDPFGAESRCLPFCDPQANLPCEPGFSCFSYRAGAETFGLCRPGCNPLNEDPPDCPTGQSCLSISRTEPFSCVGTTGGGGPGAPCASIDNCSPGLACQPPELVPGCGGGGGCCTPFCSVEVGDCPDDLVCSELAVGVGVCLLPDP